MIIYTPLRGFCVACSTVMGIPGPQRVEQANVRFHALSFIGSPYLFNNTLPTPRTYRQQQIKKKMTKKEKKFYESPTMTVYEIGRTQILAGSEYRTTTEGFDTEENDVSWN